MSTAVIKVSQKRHMGPYNAWQCCGLWAVTASVSTTCSLLVRHDAFSNQCGIKKGGNVNTILERNRLRKKENWHIRKSGLKLGLMIRKCSVFAGRLSYELYRQPTEISL